MLLLFDVVSFVACLKTSQVITCLLSSHLMSELSRVWLHLGSTLISFACSFLGQNYSVLRRTISQDVFSFCFDIEEIITIFQAIYLLSVFLIDSYYSLFLTIHLANFMCRWSSEDIWTGLDFFPVFPDLNQGHVVARWQLTGRRTDSRTAVCQLIHCRDINLLPVITWLHNYSGGDQIIFMSRVLSRSCHALVLALLSRCWLGVVWCWQLAWPDPAH